MVDIRVVDAHKISIFIHDLIDRRRALRARFRWLNCELGHQTYAKSSELRDDRNRLTLCSTIRRCGTEDDPEHVEEAHDRTQASKKRLVLSA